MKKKKKVSKLHPLVDALENQHSKYFLLSNDILAITTIVSVFAIVLETVPSFANHHTLYISIEYIATLLFTAEYVGRFIGARHKLCYIFSFFGIIDLLAILPTYLGLGNYTFLKTVRSLRIIRLLRIVRLTRMSKLTKKEGTSSLYTLNIQIYMIALGTAVLILGTLFYIFEGDHAYAQDIPSGMYWVFKAIIGGISYPQPVTTGGTIVLILARFSSMILLGLMMGLVGTMMRKLLIGSEKDS